MTTHTFDFATKCTIFRDLAQALVFFHHKIGLMHRDIKPLNLGIRCYSDPSAFLLDLDTVTTLLNDSHFIGTRRRLAPEVLAQKHPLLRKCMPDAEDGYHNHCRPLGAGSLHIRNRKGRIPSMEYALGRPILPGTGSGL